MTSNSSIRDQAGFRQMVLTDSWQDGECRLARKIRGSDVDVYFHTRSDGGAFLDCEFKRDVSTWRELLEKNRAQVEAFAGRVKLGHTLAALCKHSVPTTRDIDSRHDVDSYNLMCFDSVRVQVSKKVLDGATWFDFVDSFVRNPAAVAHKVAHSIATER